MKPVQTAASEYNPIAYEKISVQEAIKAVADPRRVYEKKWERALLRGTAAEMLDAATRAWLFALPEAVRAVELALRFPRVANNLARLWANRARCERYMSELLVVRRGDSIRQGFPPAVARELAALDAFYTATHAPHTGALAWN